MSLLQSSKSKVRQLMFSLLKGVSSYYRAAKHQTWVCRAQATWMELTGDQTEAGSPEETSGQLWT